MLNDVETGFEAAILVKPTLHAFQAHGRTLTYLAWGNPNRPPLVFLHGGLANAYWFAHIAPSFIDQFYVCALHLNGHGYSDWQDSYRLSDFSDSLDALLGQLNQAPPIIIGHSFGARIAFYFSHHYQHRIAYLCLLDPTDFTHSEVQLPRSLKQSRQISYYHDADVLIKRFRPVPEQPITHPEIHHFIATHAIIQTPDGYRWQADPNLFAKFSTEQVSMMPTSSSSGLPRPLPPCDLLYGEFSSNCTAEVLACLQAAFPFIQSFQLDSAYHALMLDQPVALIRFLKDRIAFHARTRHDAY